jgi:Protein of unknown function (DUF3619)
MNERFWAERIVLELSQGLDQIPACVLCRLRTVREAAVTRSQPGAPHGRRKRTAPQVASTKSNRRC